MHWSDALPSFLIGLREGLEAGLVVTILLAAVGKAAGGQARRRMLPVWVGALTALAVSASFAAVLTFSTSLLDARGQQILGGLLSVLAVVLVTAMIFWMRGAARTLSSQLREKVESALEIGSGAVALTAFLSVAREGLETTLFLWTSAKATGESVAPVIGATLGLAAAFALCVLLYRRAIRLNLGVFFGRTAVLLVVIAAGVLAYGVGDLQATGLIPGASWLAFDFGVVAPADSWWVTLITGITQLTPRMTVLQVTVWAVYLVGVLAAFFLEGKEPAPERPAGQKRSAWFERALQRGPWRLALAAILIPVALAAAAIWALPSAERPAAKATVTATSCGADFKPTRAGTQTITVANKSKKAGEINLLNSAGAVVGEIETLAPNTSAELTATLANGAYTLRCFMAGEQPRDSAAVFVSGSAEGPAPLPVAKVTEEDLKPVIAAYTEYVQGKLAVFAPQLDAIRAALARGDAAGARAAWLPAMVTWDEIGAAYGSFGEYGDAIDMLPHGLPDGPRDKEFVGLRRLERGLWHG
ncbi:FTR1 family protein [Segniliparus rugosus ATCC BAA-974]|uniref:FTR1 family protein n=1 Tax=Segniliparus rugosus (strain ATCC BAA-974 / DSM 45345 / CCUG 50838 / CIP 108380 / JCM 13579 / CDC 945) TaxID=679197 RepID=E5XVD5_SEGRC|nr:FTR1 family protein [Segniliparus rugosus ATCC BAA-974]